jgi:hypothetical protein
MNMYPPPYGCYPPYQIIPPHIAAETDPIKQAERWEKYLEKKEEKRKKKEDEKKKAEKKPEPKKNLFTKTYTFLELVGLLMVFGPLAGGAYVLIVGALFKALIANIAIR